MRIVFMGTSDFSLKALKALYEKSKNSNFEIVAVYSQSPKPSGRNYKVQKSVVQIFAEENEIAVYVPKTLRLSEQVSVFKSLNADLSIVSSYGLIIPQNILDIPPKGFVNIHASLLPRWRGAAPIQSAILAGDKQTGITIMKMDVGIDTGDMISMESVDISRKTNHGSLSEMLGDLGARMIVETLDNLDELLSKSRKQPLDGATYSSKISKESCRIDWQDSAENILRHVMAFSPNPSAWTEIDGIRLKIMDADVLNNSKNFLSTEVGMIATDEHGNMLVSCGLGFLNILSIQPSGKNKMPGAAFLRGHRHLIGKKFQ